MEINSKTKISKIIKENPEAIEAIASIAKPLAKLRNPILRKVLASRVNIQEACRISGSNLEQFKNALAPLGFNWSENEQASAPLASQMEGTNDNRPAWVNPKTAVMMDVRQQIDGGADPLKDIMAAFKTLEDGQALCVINSFVPTPLINLLESKGAKSFVEMISTEQYNTWLYPDTNGSTIEDEDTARDGINMIDAEAFSQKLEKLRCLKKEITLDVRDLEMPLPMQTILESLNAMADDAFIYVIHKRVPLHLLEEIGSGPYNIFITQRSENEVFLIITN